MLKAGCVYVPIDPTLPLERRRLLLTLAGTEAIIAAAENAGDLQQLEWLCPKLKLGLTLDSDDVNALVEAPGEMMSAELWDHLAREAADDIAAGGWKSAFTGQPISDAAMAAFGANARNKVAPQPRPFVMNQDIQARGQLLPAAIAARSLHGGTVLRRRPGSVHRNELGCRSSGENARPGRVATG